MQQYCIYKNIWIYFLHIWWPQNGTNCIRLQLYAYIIIISIKSIKVAFILILADNFLTFSQKIRPKKRKSKTWVSTLGVLPTQYSSWQYCHIVYNFPWSNLCFDSTINKFGQLYIQRRLDQGLFQWIWQLESGNLVIEIVPGVPQIYNTKIHT